MRAISLWQPWAQLIIDGRKHYETRHWSTDYRGPLAIHAAKTLTQEIQIAIKDFDYERFNLPFGAVVGIVDLESVTKMSQEFIGKQTLIELASGNWEEGRYAWKMTLLEKYDPPIRATGRQGFWEWRR